MLFAPVRSEISFEHAGNRLVGDFIAPPRGFGETPCPAVVVSAGSGPTTTRNWVDLGDRLAALGIASFSYDKPGCGASTGDWTRQTFPDRAREALAAAEAIGALPTVDAGRIGLIGGSQGGWVAPLAASMSDSVGAVVCVSGPGVSVADSERYQVTAEGLQSGHSGQEIADALALFDRLLSGVRSSRSAADIMRDEIGLIGTRVAELAELTSVKELEFFAGIADYHPAEALRNVRCPLLAVFGADDVFVPVEASVAAFEQAGHRAVVFPGADHRVMTLDPATGQRRRAPGLFELIVSWLTETLGRRASG